jgi:uncharacterized iron-regulated membrane protein
MVWFALILVGILLFAMLIRGLQYWLFPTYEDLRRQERRDREYHTRREVKRQRSTIRPADAWSVWSRKAFAFAELHRRRAADLDY